MPAEEPVGADPGDVATTDAPGPDKQKRKKRRRLLPAPIWHIGKLLIVALIVEYLVLPQVAGTRKAIKLLGDVHPAWLLLGVVLEALALLAYTQLTRVVLPKDSDPGLWTIFRVQVTTRSVSHCVPAGSAAGTSLGYRLMTLAGSRGSDAGLAMSLQATGSAVILNIIFWLALIVSIPVSGFSPLDLTAGLVGLVLVAVFTVLVVFLRRGETWANGVIARVGRHVPFVDVTAAQRSLSDLIRRFGELEADKTLVIKASIWAALNWLLDAASLYVFVGAFGYWVNPDGLILAFSIANVLAVLPITPGGLGVVEATLTSTLVGFDTPRGIAILGVIAYRLVEFWAPIPAGGLTYLSLQFNPGSTPISRAAADDTPTGELTWKQRRRRLAQRAKGGPAGQPEQSGPAGTSAGKDVAGEVADLSRPPPGPVAERG